VINEMKKRLESPLYVDRTKKRIDHNILRMVFYTMLPPRRILDYTLLRFRKSYSNRLSKDYNYLIVNNKKIEFIFNQYKTSKKYN
jgi:hypothetical protein